MDFALEKWALCLEARSAETCRFAASDGWLLFGIFLGLILLTYAGRNFLRFLLTLPALAWMPALSRRLSNWVKSRDYTEEEFLRADGAAPRWVEVRKTALDHLATFLQNEHNQSIAWANAVRESFSDLRFTDANRVPFPFVRVMREKFNLCSVVTASKGPRLQTLDGNWTLDVSGSYGVNVAGFDRYKDWIQKGWERVPAEAAHYRAGGNSCDNKGQGLHAQNVADKNAAPSDQEPQDRAEDSVTVARGIRPPRIVAVLNQGIEQAVFDRFKSFVKAVFEAAHQYSLSDCSGRKNTA